ncbi:hypothetical protein [Nocardioides bruguierae]|uniref:Uncharacterized protein n=1 Tax=Nocardioides bruguierae TaxID=2945102 RepID=A0A9X2D9U6_9ACTN|nr:hypothetical protein [Nocardioides bruguierae]MCM0621942.1 hypothetical protein [Nocardioides bruguierae]
MPLAPPARNGHALSADASSRLTHLLASVGEHVNAELGDGVLWHQWRMADKRLACFGGLHDVVVAWHSTDVPVRPAIAGLTAIGCERGGDQQPAALAVLTLLAGGICRTAHDLAEVCQPEDVVSAMWQEIRAAEPQIGDRAARHLVMRTRARLLRENGTRQERNRHLPMGGPEDLPESTEQPAPASAVELVDLLAWARGTAVLAPDEVGLIAELVDGENSGTSREQVLRTVAASHGWALSTLRAHRRQVIDKLRDAAADYLAATA